MQLCTTRHTVVATTPTISPHQPAAIMQTAVATTAIAHQSAFTMQSVSADPWLNSITAELPKFSRNLDRMLVSGSNFKSPAVMELTAGSASAECVVIAAVANVLDANNCRDVSSSHLRPSPTYKLHEKLLTRVIGVMMQGTMSCTSQILTAAINECC